MSQLSTKSLMLRSCYLFYVKGMNILQIAEALDISRFRVSRYIDEAREKGLITFQINDPDINYEAEALQLEQAFGLKRVIVARIAAGATPEEKRRAIGKAGAVLFQGLKETCSIAMTWGRTMAYLAEEIPSNASKIETVVELAGSVGKITASISAHNVTAVAAQKLKATCIQLPAPIIVDHVDTARALMREPVIRQALDLATGCDMAICGVGPIRDLDSSLHHAGYLTKKEMASLETRGALGSLFGHFIDKSGEECDTEYKDRVIALSLDQYRSIPERIILAGGEQKIDVLYALADNHIITGLVTDHETAADLLVKKAATPLPSER